MNILITNISYHCSIGAIKLLRKITTHSINIIGTSNIPFGYSSGSLLVNRFYEVTSVENKELYLRQIKEICKKCDIDFILSSDEKEQLIFSSNLDILKGKVVINTVDIIELFTHKFEATQAISKLGIPTPKIYLITELSEISNKKVIVRKNVSCCSYGIHVLNKVNEQTIEEYLNEDCFIQEFIDGDEYTIDVLCDINGTPINIIPRKRLAIRNGISYKCLIEKNDILIELCKKIYNAYKIPGFSNVQFIVNKKDAYFIELNPRLGGTTIASSLCGDNLMEIYIDHFIYNLPLKKSIVKWNSVVTRYYEETVYYTENERNEK